MKLRLLKKVRKYEDWDDRDRSWSTSEYEDDPVLQYYDAKKKKWIDVPEVTEVVEMYTK